MSVEESEPARSLNRRDFVRTAIAVGAVASVAVPAIASADADAPLSTPQRQVMVDIARLVATKPVPFPTFGESGEALRRADGKRLASVLENTSADRIQRAGDGAARLLDAKFGGADDEQVRLIGEFMAGNDAVVHEDLRAVVAVAVATISTHYRADHDHAANLWLDFARNYYLRTRIL